MAIREYESTDGKRLFMIKCSSRSKVNPKVRIQKQAVGVKSLQEARTIERRLQKEIQREIFEREQMGCTWKVLINEWEKALRDGKGLHGVVSESTVYDYVRPLHNYTSHWFSRPAKEIEPADVREVLDELERLGRTPGRIKKVKNYIHSAFKWGMETGRIRGVSQTPAQGIHIHERKNEKRPEILSLNEIRKLLEFARHYEHAWHSIWAMALLTGMRSGELFALLWSDVDWENKRISVTKSFNKRQNKIGPTKAGYWREIPINPDLEALLKELRGNTGSTEYVLPRCRDWYRGEQAKVLRNFCLGVGLPSVKFHTLRACFATQLLRDKVAPAVVMKICGWKDLKTMQHYIRLAGIEVEGATDGLKLLTPRQTMGRVVELFRS